MSKRLPISESRIALFGGLMLLAMGIRVVCSFLIGSGSFGPDGSGAEAAVHLGGHPNVLHPILIEFFGGGRGLSAFSGAVTALACAKMGQRLGGNPWVCGLMGACAPLLVMPASMAGGDSPALALAATGVALAWWQKPFSGGLIAGLSLGVKAIALPVLLLLPLGILWSEKRTTYATRIVFGFLGPFILFLSALDPLLTPRLNSGILGSWWLSSDGAPPGFSELPGMSLSALWEISTIPTWTGHPLLGLLALWGCFQVRDRKVWSVLVISGLGLFLVAFLLGDQLRVRYLGPASIGITVVAGLGLSRLRWLPWVFLWPCLAFASQLGHLRSMEEGLNPRPQMPFIGPINVELSFEEGGICGGNELRDLAVQLSESLPINSEVAAIRLRDGRENELFWRLRILRPDLQLTALNATCCETNSLPNCAREIRTHLYQRGGALVAPHLPTDCKTLLASPDELALAEAFNLRAQAKDRFNLMTWVNTESQSSFPDACSAANQRPD